MFKVNNKDTRTTPIVDASVSIVNFDRVNAGWKRTDIVTVTTTNQRFNPTWPIPC